LKIFFGHLGQSLKFEYDQIRGLAEIFNIENFEVEAYLEYLNKICLIYLLPSPERKVLSRLEYNREG
jgi:hypothetical protein